MSTNTCRPRSFRYAGGATEWPILIAILVVSIMAVCLARPDPGDDGYYECEHRDCSNDNDESGRLGAGAR